MRIALLGLQGSGKTSVLGAISDSPVEMTPGVVQTETHLQVIKVKDPRLERCREIFSPKKFTPAGLELRDPPGLPTGPTEGDRERRVRLLSNLRDAEAYVLVVRDFVSDQYPYERPAADAKADLTRLAEEMLSADFVIAETRASKLRDSVQKKTKTADQDKIELALLERCLAAMDAGEPLRSLEFDAADHKRLKGFQFFGLKPYVLVVNGAEGLPEGIGEGVSLDIRARMTLDAQLEAELAAMDENDRPEFMAEFGIEEVAAERFVRELYEGVGLRSFFTVGEDECRAWTIRSGDDAVTAAGKIHTDLAKGFVRAEVCSFEELDAAGGLKEVKAAGQLRLEPKDYVVADGDIVHIRSAV